ncbi:DUF4430 domain-containing protein [Bacillus sp. JJ722]|uniref:DUF4430 domain-containing protein n=1 Tax=Bacillus sp. JJ722 TaxID=3122973 RepID=UPI002FFE4131
MKKKWFALISSIVMSFLLIACNVQSVEEYEREEKEFAELKANANESEQTASKNQDKNDEEQPKIENSSEKAINQPSTNPLEKKNPEIKQPEDKKTNPSEKRSSKDNPTNISISIPKKEEQPSNSEPIKKPVTKPAPKKKYVTVSIRIDTILDNMDKLDSALNSPKYVPKDGVILKTTKYELQKEKENVFDVLVRATREHEIQMEYQGASENQYGSVYIQGINHLYEFSVGELSGWMYSVNDWYPNYGASKYILKDGDKIEWNYTCDLGRDLGVNWVDEKD